MSHLSTKPELVDALRQGCKERGGELRHVSGDCYVGMVGSELRLAVALKETRQMKKILLSLPDPLGRLLHDGLEVPGEHEPLTVSPLCAFIVLIHVPRNRLVLIHLLAAYRDVVQRADIHRRDEGTTFNLSEAGYRKYVIKTDEFRNDISVPVVENLDTLWTVFQHARTPSGE